MKLLYLVLTFILSLDNTATKSTKISTEVSNHVETRKLPRNYHSIESMLNDDELSVPSTRSEMLQSAEKSGKFVTRKFCLKSSL